MDILTHPNIWKFSASITALCLGAMVVCISTQNHVGMTINGMFFILNGIAAIGNYKLRHIRQKTMDEANRAEAIRLTIGE